LLTLEEAVNLLGNILKGLFGVGVVDLSPEVFLEFSVREQQLTSSSANLTLVSSVVLHNCLLKSLLLFDGEVRACGVSF